LSPGSPETLSNPPVFWGNASIIVLGDAGRGCKVRCINSFILVCESQDTNSPRGGGGVALCREGWDGEFNEQTSLLNSKAENLFALEGNAAVLHGQDVGVAL
jgi:hypothetical protein